MTAHDLASRRQDTHARDHLQPIDLTLYLRCAPEQRYRRPHRGANVGKATLRVTFWGALAMALTVGIGAILGTVV
jgi:hypothetical protein